MTRDKLPSRRAADVVTFQLKGRRWTGSVSRFHDCRPTETFLDRRDVSPIGAALTLFRDGEAR